MLIILILPGLDIKNKLILLKKIENFNLNNIFLINKIDLKDEIEVKYFSRKLFYF
jgi:hypothetical protein